MNIWLVCLCCVSFISTKSPYGCTYILEKSTRFRVANNVYLNFVIKIKQNLNARTEPSPMTRIWIDQNTCQNGLKSMTHFAGLFSIFMLGIQREQKMLTAFDLNTMYVISVLNMTHKWYKIEGSICRWNNLQPRSCTQHYSKLGKLRFIGY